MEYVDGYICLSVGDDGGLYLELEVSDYEETSVMLPITAEVIAFLSTKLAEHESRKEKL